MNDINDYMNYHINQHILKLTKVYVIKRFNQMGLNASEVEKMSDMNLMCQPESTILVNVFNYSQLKKNGIADNQIFNQIENYRKQFDKSNDSIIIPNDLNIYKYIIFRIELDLSNTGTGFKLGFMGITKEYIIEIVNDGLKYIKNNNIY